MIEFSIKLQIVNFPVSLGNFLALLARRLRRCAGTITMEAVIVFLVNCESEIPL